MSDHDADYRQLSPQQKRALLASLLRERTMPADMVLPLSLGQKALWLLHQRAPDSAAYNTAFAVRVRSTVDPDALRTGLQTIVERHAALRTTFAAENGNPVARTSAQGEVRFTRTDAGGWSDEALEQRVAADYRQPFDLARGPLLRVSLYSRAPADHVLLLTLHHIICDAWSMWMLMHELSILYPAALAGDPAGLPEVEAQYADYVAWQNRILAGPEGERMWQYWRDKLSGELPIIELPTDRPRPVTQQLRGGSHFFELDGLLAQKLLEVGKTQGATLFMGLLAVFQTLLHRYSGQDDIIVGSPVVGRNHPDMAATIGYFANPLPLRADLSGDPTFREFLSQIRHTVLDALSYQDLPFPLLVERLQPKRDPSRWPVFEVMLVLQRPPQSEQFLSLLAGESAGRVSWAGLLVEPFPLAQMEGQFDLTWEVVEGRSSLACVLKYNPDLFDADTIRRMEGSLRTLIEAVAADPDQRVSRLPLLTADERQQVLVAWQGRETAYPLGRCLHHWIEDQVERSPDATAVMLADGGGALSYRELDAHANRLARHLRRLGVGPDAIVGVLAERSVELVVGLLGILKAGGAYLPLDPEYPRQRLAYMVADARVAVLLTHGRLYDELSGTAGRVVRLDADWPVIAREDRSKPAVDVAADNLAYLIYTSGSTGQPKGAENTHRGICNRLLWMQEEYGLDHTDRVLQKTPFGFDVSVWELFWPLMTGATLVMARPGGHRDRDYLVETIAARSITTVHFVPSMLEVFLEAHAVSRCQATLRRVFCSGEALPVELQQRLFERLDVDLHNLYGPTEAAVDVAYWRCRRDAGLRTVPIGRPIANTRIYLLDRRGQLVPVGVPGELHIGGVAVARGYRNRPELTAEKFIPDPFGHAAGDRLYRTGDLCRWLPDGNIEYLQRIDFQVKVRGFRIELGEIEAALCSHPQVRAALVRVERDGSDARLLAWFVPRGTGDAPAAGELRRFLRERLPEYMVPAAFVPLDALPLTPNGKADRAALPLPAVPVPMALPRTAVEQQIADIWRNVLRLDNPGVDDSFFDVGGHSLLLARVQTRLAEAFGRAPSMVDMFQFPTIRGLAGFYADAPAAPAAHVANAPGGSTDIAIIGLAGRLPGAPNVETFWRNLSGGVESIRVFSDAELAAAGVPAAVLADPSYVKAFGALDDIEAFDAGFFGCTPREAELMDVQHRLLLECAWVALENAGHDLHAEDRRCGMFAGVGMNRYLLGNLLPHRGLLDSADAYQLMLGNDKDFAPTRASYKLGLTGPSISVQTACSTSLVAVHLACRSLLAGECDTALAGGCSVTLPQNRGYRYQEGMILSPDGHCRAFDADARGTVGGSGVGFVVLKRLADALADGDHTYAVIKGSAINNDGAAKAGYTAPGVAGQAAVIGAALTAAGVDPDTVGYVEAHGTGTPLGDPIEIAALTRVFRASTARTGYCALGSVKTNVGHLDSAAGVAGLIKATLAVERGLVPPSLHFQTPNPALELTQSPFYVPKALRPWSANGMPRRAGVSSFGIGGTNAHVVLEQAPEPPPTGPSRPFQLLLLSAKQPAALEAATAQLAQHLRQHPQLDLADVAFTLARGRRAFAHRRMLVCRTLEEAIAALDGSAAAGAGRETVGPSSAAEAGACAVAFMFPGQGAQHVGMAAEIYRSEPVFRDEIDRCAQLLQPHVGFDLRELLYPATADAGTGDERLKQTAIAQPALFVVEYALARLWMSWGVRPEALIGHSLGEYVAACLANVWTLEDALAVIALRGELMQRQPSGAMLAVSLAESEAQRWLRPELALAAVNGPGLCVVSGPQAAVDRLAGELGARDIACRPLHTSHAFHSPIMTPAVEPLRARLREIECRAPTIPFVSNVTGDWIQPAQATDPEYWARHLVQTVRFSDGLDVLLQQPHRCLIEVGPGNTLTTLALRHPRRAVSQTVVTSLRHPQERRSDAAQLVEALGKVWVAGGQPDWAAFYAGQRRSRLALPTYPFQRQRYWVDPPEGDATDSEMPERKHDLANWFYLPSWQRTAPRLGAAVPGAHWLLLMDDCGVGAALARQLADRGIEVARVNAGSGFERVHPAEFVIHPGAREDYVRLLTELRQSDRFPDVVVHLWCVTKADAEPVASPAARDRSFHSLVFLAQALGDQEVARDCHITVVSNRLHDVAGDEQVEPDKALLLGPVAVIPQEYQHLACTSIDVDLDPRYRDLQLERLLADAAVAAGDSPIAYRRAHRWSQVFVPAPLAAATPPVRPGGTYLITGGTGGVGLALAEWLARTAPGVRLALISRSAGAEERSELRRVPAVEPVEAPAGVRSQRFDLKRMAAFCSAVHARLKAQQPPPDQPIEVIQKALDHLCVLYITRFLQQSGIALQPGRCHEREQIRRQLRLLPKFDKFLSFFLKTLVQEGILAQHDNGSVTVTQALPGESAEHASHEFCQRFPQLAAVDRLLQHCARHFGPALSGEIETIGVLYPEGSLDLLGAELALTRTLSQRGLYIEMLAQLAGKIAADLSGRKLRVLEVGGGGGELTLALMQRLKTTPIEYWFTDIGRSIVLSAERKAATFEFDSMRFAVLDIEHDPQPQGFEPAGFDLIVGLDVVHATQRIDATLGHLKQLVAPGGWLCLLESVKSRHYLDMIWGLADGWWHFADHELRQHSPLLEISQWIAVLRNAGFAQVEAWPGAGAEREATDFALIIAQAYAIVEGKAGRGGPSRTDDSSCAPADRLRALGAEVLVLGADVGDRAQMQRAIDQIRERFGDIHGVIHAAGIAGGGTIQVKTRADAEAEFRAKVDGSLVLESVLAGAPLDFFVLCSSLTSATGGFGQIAYSAACAFQDAFATARAASGPDRRVIAVDWDRWQSIGMGASLETRHRELTGEELAGGMQAVQGLEVFGRILAAAPEARIIVSTRDFPALVRQARSWQLGRLERQVSPIGLHPRPALANGYVAPAGETARLIAETWQQELGIEQVGAHDEFIALGGDSLIAIKLVSRLRQLLGVPLNVRALYDAPTVSSLAEHVASLRWVGQGRTAETAEEHEEGVL